MDRVGAGFQRTVDEMNQKFSIKCVPVQIPAGEGEYFTGIIDLVDLTYRVYHDETLGATFTDYPIPDDMKAAAAAGREHLLEAVAEFDDLALDKFLHNKVVEAEDINRAIRKGTIKCAIVPILCGSSFRNRGIQKLLDAIVNYLPSPVDLPPVKGYHPESMKEISRKADPDEPAAALAFKIQSDPHAGKLCYIRVYSGAIKPGVSLLNPNSGIRERVSRILQMHSNKKADVDIAEAGDIVALIGCRKTTTGDTLCDPKHPVMLEVMKFPEPVIFVAIEPKSKADQDKLQDALIKLEEEDPTFKMRVNEETGQTIISGMGELHLEILIDRMIREFKVQANVGKPSVAYKETISEAVEAEGKFIRQSGGKGQYGHVWLKVEPLQNGSDFKFENQIVSSVIPKEYIPHIERGIREAMSNGAIAGYPLTGIKAILFDGSFHDVDSNELAFKVAASMALQEAVRKAHPIILEPLMNVEVVCPELYMGNVVGDLNLRRGKIGGMVPRDNVQVITAAVPLAEMFGYATALRNLTQGRGSYTMQFARYAPLPKEVAMKMFSNIMYA
jgi:elongation factor G